jgi:hypothetical protein
MPGSHAEFAETLLVESPAGWEERAIPLEARGVSREWLSGFIDAIYRNHNEPLRQDYHRRRDAVTAYDQQRSAADHMDWVPQPTGPRPSDADPDYVEFSTRQFVADIVLPLTAAHRVPLYARVPEAERGQPNIFLSHAWDAVLLAKGEGQYGRYGTMDAFGRGVAGVQEKYVWVDFVCYNQHTVGVDSIAFDMEQLIRAIGQVAFAITPIPLFDRVWCLWEVVSVARNSVRSRFCVGPGYRTDTRVLVNHFFEAFKGVRHARASLESDRQKILGALEQNFGTLGEADAFIVKLMRSSMSGGYFGLAPG